VILLIRNFGLRSFRTAKSVGKSLNPKVWPNYVP